MNSLLSLVLYGKKKIIKVEDVGERKIYIKYLKYVSVVFSAPSHMMPVWAFQASFVHIGWVFPNNWNYPSAWGWPFFFSKSAEFSNATLTKNKAFELFLIAESSIAQLAYECVSNHKVFGLNSPKILLDSPKNGMM